LGEVILHPIPERINQIINTDLIKNNMDQLIINEYKPGQGIAAHIDHEKFFGPIIICLTVFSGTEINFINKFNDLDVKTIRVEPRSLYIMSGDARYKYKHEICHRIEDHGIKRGTRISLTYRSVINT
jgi:alkylated DNA repair dioxygenase AlkB